MPKIDAAHSILDQLRVLRQPMGQATARIARADLTMDSPQQTTREKTGSLAFVTTKI